MSSFADKVVLVTGCSSGMGLATTNLFLSRSAKVFGVDINPFNADLPASQHPNFSFHQINLTDASAPETVVTACKAKFGPTIHVLCNIAGIMDTFASADTVKEENWARVIAVNLTAPVLLMQAVLPSMIEAKGGAIVNVGSYASISGASAGIAYTASKHGLAGATKNVAWRFHDQGIRCNAVLPGGELPVLIYDGGVLIHWTGVMTNINASMPPETWDHAAFNVLQ